MLTLIRPQFMTEHQTETKNMDILALRMLCLEQEHRTLEDHSTSARQPVSSTLAPRLFCSPLILATSPCTLVPPAAPWSVIALPTPWTSGLSAMPRPSTTGALLGSAFLLAPPWSSVSLAPHQSSSTLAPPWLLITAVLPWPPRPACRQSHLLLGCTWVSKSPSSTTGGRNADSIEAPPTICSGLGLHSGCALGSHLAPPTFIASLAPPSVSSMVSISADSSQFLPVSSSSSFPRSPNLPPHLDYVVMPRGCAFQEGGVMSGLCLVLFSFIVFWFCFP
ncbi:uncharacterized protein LOC125267880 [Megalobrama amblycephala]|uniref:uncharacterized protein LOC125267880 n=1 Tax=Megalobrama amblycephala TaxID=75352 RepID=UPI002013D28B|nr:uncharacterized protein LOC125267880 [Megalobrama amblycephala]